MQKVAVITTGGTIGSIFNADAVAVDSNASRVAVEIEIAAKKLGCRVVIESLLNKHSENLDPQDWGLILKAIEKACASDAVAVVVTHGSDTMAYTVAAALSFAHCWSKKICFTGSFYAPEHPLSDAALNLHAALAFSLSSSYSSGVFMAFRNGLAQGQADIFNAAAIKPMNFDSVSFDPAYDNVLMEFTPSAGLSTTSNASLLKAPCLPTAVIPSQAAIERAKRQVVCIRLYPGIDKSLLQAAAKGRAILVIELYHSGTGPVGIDSELMEFLAELKASDSELQVLMGTFPRQHITLPYQSTLTLKCAGANIYADLQTHFLQVFSLLAIATGMCGRQIIEALSTFEQQ